MWAEGVLGSGAYGAVAVYSANGPIPIEENASFQDLNGRVWQNTRAAKFNILICFKS